MSKPTEVIIGIPQVLKNNEHRMEKFLAKVEILLDRWAGDTLVYARASAAVGVSHELSDNIDIETPDRYTRLVVADAPHAAATEYGSRPHFPPVEELQAWALSRLGSIEAAYGVALRISMEGTKPQPFMRPAFEKVYPQAVKEAKALVKKVGG